MTRIMKLALTLAASAIVASWPCQRDAYAEMPFANATASPTVSPYLNLAFNPGRAGTYQTLVQPIVRGGQELAQQRSQISSLQGQTQALARQAQSAGGASRGIRGTGHVTSYMYYSHFYPRR